MSPDNTIAVDNSPLDAISGCNFYTRGLGDREQALDDINPACDGRRTPIGLEKQGKYRFTGTQKPSSSSGPEESFPLYFENTI